MAQPDALGALAGGAEEDFGRGGVRVLFQEVMLDLPGVVVAQPVGELDLGQRILQQLVLALGTPRPRELVLVEDAEFHGSVPLSVIPTGAKRSGGTCSCGCKKKGPSTSLRSARGDGFGYLPSQNFTIRSISVGIIPAGKSCPQPGQVWISAAGTRLATSRPHATGSSGSSSPCRTSVGTLMPLSCSTRSPEAMIDRYCRAPPSGYQRRSTFFSTKARSSASGAG